MPPPSIPSLLSALCPPETSQLHIISSTLVSCIKLHLLDPVGATMLPSYTHTLPRGTETGAALAVDLGGSTLRVAVVRFSAEGKEVVRRKQWGVDEDVKILQGGEFFDWVAERVAEVVGEKEEEEVMGYGLTWSFPIVQTSEGSGEIQKMGKGFRIHEGILGEDLRTHFEAAFKRRNLNNLRLTYLLNDTAAALLSHAYDNPKTCISLICGTGVNAALLLPVHALHPQKFGVRPREWFEAAEKVLVNTECSMLGGEVMFPLTDADRLLDEMAELPGFQPFEQLTGGRYLGEVARLTLVDAGILEIAGGGGRWSLSSEVLAAFEEDTTLDSAVRAFEGTYGITLTPADITSVAGVCRAVARRAAAYLAVMLYSLYQVLEKEEAVVVACCGAVIENHPSVRRRCQELLDELAGKGRVVLDMAEDSGLMGAAVGVVIAAGE